MLFQKHKVMSNLNNILYYIPTTPHSSNSLTINQESVLIKKSRLICFFELEDQEVVRENQVQAMDKNSLKLDHMELVGIISLIIDHKRQLYHS